jgi:hypothetical protein
MRRTKSFSSIAAAVVVAMAIAGTVVATGSAGPAQSAGNQLAGTWQATVNRPAPLPPLQSLQIFTSDGSAIEMSNEWPATRSALYSSWERIEGRTYASTGVHFLFNSQTGALIGSRKINRTIELAEDGQSFSAVARVTTFDPNGNVLGVGTATSSGERMQVERIQP